MGRWSRPLARRFVRWIGAPRSAHWLDVGCGTGALTKAICDVADPASVVACDRSPSFAAHAGAELGSEVSVLVAEVGDLPPRDGGYDVVASSLVLNFLPDPREAVREQLGLLRAGGIAAACVWDYAEGMEFLRRFWDAAGTVAPEASEADEGRRFPVCDPERLERVFREAGARDTRGGWISVPTVFEGFDDFWRPFLGGPGPAPGFVASLEDGERSRLEEELRRGLPEQGEIRLEARAWVHLGHRA